jgi:hypothetical protein
MDFNDDVVDRRRWFRPLREYDPGCFRGLIHRDDCLHWYLRASRARRLYAPVCQGVCGVGAENPVTSCDVQVNVEESAEPVSS